MVKTEVWTNVHWQLECYVVTLEKSVYERFVIVSFCFMVTFIILTKILFAEGFGPGVKLLTDIVYNVIRRFRNYRIHVTSASPF